MRNLAIDECELLGELSDAIASLPSAHVRERQLEQSQRNLRYAPDGLFDISLHDHALVLAVEVKSELFPRDVHQQIWKLREFLSRLEGADEKVAMLAAGSISQGARDILQSERVGYFDQGGSLFIPSGHAYILIDRPPSRKAERAIGSLFQGQRARVVQAVVEAYPDWLSVKNLAERTGVSAATASETLSEMERRGWLDSEGAGPAKLRRLRERGPVLDEWARLIGDQRQQRIERYYVEARDAAELARMLERACGDVDASYAITAEAAAQAYAPYLSAISQVKCRIAADRRRGEVLSRLGARVRSLKAGISE